MAMADYTDMEKTAARNHVRARTAANFAEVCRRLGPKCVVPAGGEYVLGGSVAAQSRFLPQPLEGALRGALKAGGVVVEALAKLYPGDELDSASGAVVRDPRARMRDFNDDERAAYASGLAGERESYADVALPADATFEWPRAMAKAAKNYQARREKLGLSLDMDVYIEAVRFGDRRRLFVYRLALDGPAAGFCDTVGQSGRKHLAYRIDEKMLFCLLTGLLSWNAMEASALLEVRRQPDVYEHDAHRSIVHFTLLS
jgi:hypothetical protein